MDLQEQSLPEITVKALVLGVVLSIVLAAANAYLGLFAGMTVSASIPAAVVSMGVLRLFRKSNILENNIVQTAASAGESLAAGVIFTLPALVILGTWESFSFKWVAIIAGFGGVLGVLFTIPLRRSLIVEGKLKFPEGIATAEVLETGRKDLYDVEDSENRYNRARYFWLTATIGIPLILVYAGALYAIVISPYRDSNIVITISVIALMVTTLFFGLIQAFIVVKRFHDLDRPWTHYFLIFIPIYNIYLSVILMFQKGTEGPNRYGPDPLVRKHRQTDITSSKGLRLIAHAAVASGLFKVGAGALGFWPEVVDGAKVVGGSIAYFGSNLSPALLSVGYIVGMNIAVLIFIGGACNWLVAIPICAAIQGPPSGEEISAVDWAFDIWSSQTRYIGVGGMVVGGLWTIFRMRKSLISGIASGLRAYRDVTTEVAVVRTEQDMSMKWILILIVGSVVPLFLLYQIFVQQIQVSVTMAVIMLVTGFVFSAVAGYMAGLVGSSNNPISGVTIATVLVSSLLLVLLMGKGAENGPAAAIIIGSVVCCAAAIAGDNMQDLKAGYLVKATPWKQQIMQLVGTVSAALVLAPVMILLQKAYGFAGQADAGPKALAAPQANLMASVAQGVFRGELPWDYVFIGMAVAVVLIILDLYLESRGSTFRAPVLAVAIGIYLPFELAVPIFAGGLIHQAVKFYNKRRADGQDEVEGSSRNGLLFASGLITGEALMGIIMAIPIVILAKLNISLPLWEMPMGSILGIVLLIGVAFWLYRTALSER